MRRTGLSHRHPPPAPPKPKSPHSGGGPGCLHLTGSLGESVTLEVRNALQGRSEAVWGNLKALGARPSCPGRHQGACDVLMHQASVSASSEGRPGMVSPGASEAPRVQQRPAGPPPSPPPCRSQVQVRGSSTLRGDSERRRHPWAGQSAGGGRLGQPLPGPPQSHLLLLENGPHPHLVLKAAASVESFSQGSSPISKITHRFGGLLVWEKVTRPRAHQSPKQGHDCRK